MSRLRRTWPQRLLLTLNVGLIVACLALAATFRASAERAEAINRYDLNGTLTGLEDDDEGRFLNVLLVGSDSSSTLDPDDPIQTGRQGERNGDVIIVAHLDERTDSAALLSFPRDLWVPIAGTDSEQKINAAYEVGGPETLIETIEERFGIPIHAYVQVDFAGFQGLVEAVGAVPVWFDAPARDWNEAAGISQTGFETLEAGCVELGPEQALAYVRSRYYQTLDEDGTWITDERSDLGRIARQQDFLRRLLVRAVDQGARNPFTLRRLIDVALERVTVDQRLTPQDLLDLGRRFSDFDPGDLGAYTVPARFGTVGTASVLFTEDDALEPVLELFRGAAVDDPSTVRIKVQYDEVDASEVTALTSRLRRAGYTVTGSSPAPVVPGIVVRHAAGAGEAAAQVAGVVWPGAPVVLDETLPGRDVVVSLGGGEVGDADPGDERPVGDGDDSDADRPDASDGSSASPAGDGRTEGLAPIDPATACR